MQRSTSALMALLLAACTASPPPAPPTPSRAPARASEAPAPGGPEVVSVAPTRSEEECREVLAHGPLDRNATIVPPLVMSIVAPPLDGVPYVQRGVRIQVRLFVDQHGVVAADSTRLDPMITSRRYDRDFRAAMAHTRFRPAVVEGCAVPAWAALSVTLPD